jgi:hypothetical protein
MVCFVRSSTYALRRTTQIDRRKKEATADGGVKVKLTGKLTARRIILEQTGTQLRH